MKETYTHKECNLNPEDFPGKGIVRFNFQSYK